MAQYGSFTIDNDPAQPDFSVRNLSVPETVGQSRFQLRQKLLAGTEQLSSVNQMVARPKSLTTYYDQAMELMTSSKARDAFNIQLESPELREKYGYSSIGQCALLSRRLVEAGAVLSQSTTAAGIHTLTISPAMKSPYVHQQIVPSVLC